MRVKQNCHAVEIHVLNVPDIIDQRQGWQKRRTLRKCKWHSKMYARYH